MSDEISLSLKLPKEIEDILKVKNLSKEIRLLIAIELYREESFSLGKAAEIAGIGLRELFYELRKREVPLNYDIEEMNRDLDSLEGLL